MTLLHHSRRAPLTVGSLFSGIGGFDLGLERTGGFRTSWFCEQDPYCQAVLAKHWPGVPIHPDITELHHPAYVDVLCGGFPCQDLSYAGLGAGLSGARSGLWTEYARLIGEVGPRYVVVENVSALLARGLGVVLGDLAALGYDAEWDCIPASAVGAPHQRDRVWLVAYPSGSRLEGTGPSRPAAGGGRQPANAHHAASYADEGRLAVRSERDGGQDRPEQPAPRRRDADGLRAALADPDEERRDGRAGEQRPSGRGEPADRREDVADAESERRGSQRPLGAREAGADDVTGHAGERRASHAWAVEPDVGRVAHGVPSRVDRLAALGNTLVPQIPEWIGHRILAYEAEGAVTYAAA